MSILLPVLMFKIAGWVANSVDSDQMLHSAASDLGLHCTGASVSGKRMCTIPVNHFEDSLPSKSAVNWLHSSWPHWVDWAIKPQTNKQGHCVWILQINTVPSDMQKAKSVQITYMCIKRRLIWLFTICHRLSLGIQYLGTAEQTVPSWLAFLSEHQLSVYVLNAG